MVDAWLCHGSWRRPSRVGAVALASVLAACGGSTKKQPVVVSDTSPTTVTSPAPTPTTSTPVTSAPVTTAPASTVITTSVAGNQKTTTTAKAARTSTTTALTFKPGTSTTPVPIRAGGIADCVQGYHNPPGDSSRC